MAFLILLAAASTDLPKAPAAAPMCQETRARTVTVARPHGPHTLDREPRAQAYRAVIRTVDGCTRPVKVREDVPAR